MIPDLAAAPAATPASSFCPGCGTPVLSAAPCPACARPAPAASTASDHLRPIQNSLVFYFALLAVCVGSAFIALSNSYPSARWLARLDIAATAALTLITAGACIVGRDELRPLLSRTGPARWYLFAPLLSLGTFAFAASVCSISMWIFGIQRAHESFPFHAAGYPWWTPILLISIQPGIFEELAFRGLIFSWLARVLGRRETLVATAILFGTLHLSPVMFIHTSVLGVILGLMRLRTGSLYPGMLLHACHNGLVLIQLSILEHPP